MKIYLDSEFRCYAEAAEGRTEVETEIFDGKCKALIEGYRYIPAGETWTREDGVVFAGEMVAPWKDYAGLAAAQAGYEEALVEIQTLQNENQDMQSALELLIAE